MNIKPLTVLTNLQRGNVKQESPTLLHHRNQFELAAQGELYSVEADILNSVDENNMTPLMWAAGYGQTATVDFLLRSGADPNHRANRGRTALMLAASKGFYYVVKTLIVDGARINDIDDSGNSALIYACHQNHPLVIQELIRNGADLSLINVLGQTAYGISLLANNKGAQAIIEAHLVSTMKGRGSNIRQRH